jgi:hypothetical protein
MKYEQTTIPAPDKGYYAKVMTIPRLSFVYINTFNMIFEVYYISAWSTPIIEKYGVSLTDTNIRLTKFPQLGIAENNLLDNVGYVVNDKDIDIYVKSNVKDACIYINVLGVTPTDISIKHDYANFVSTQPDNIVYANTKSSYIDNIKDLETRLKRGLIGSVYHSSTTANIILPENNRSYFGIISDDATKIAYVNIGLTGTITITNIGTSQLSATYDNTTQTITVSGLGTQKFLHYMLSHSY